MISDVGVNAACEWSLNCSESQTFFWVYMGTGMHVFYSAVCELNVRWHNSMYQKQVSKERYAGTQAFSIAQDTNLKGFNRHAINLGIAAAIEHQACIIFTQADKSMKLA